MNFTFKDGYVTEQDFCSLYKCKVNKENTEYIAKRSWLDAARYCNDLSLSLGLTPCYENLDKDTKDASSVICNYEKDGYRLPTTEEGRMEYAKDLVDIMAIGQFLWCDNIFEEDKTKRGAVKLDNNSNSENRTIITEYFDTNSLHPFKIGKKLTFNDYVLETMPKIGQGLDTPLLIKDNMALFRLYNGEYALCYKGLGLLKNFGKENPTDIIEFLRNEGFKDVMLNV